MVGTIAGSFHHPATRIAIFAWGQQAKIRRMLTQINGLRTAFRSKVHVGLPGSDGLVLTPGRLLRRHPLAMEWLGLSRVKKHPACSFLGDPSGNPLQLRIARA
jgi:hypothetical protein